MLVGGDDALRKEIIGALLLGLRDVRFGLCRAERRIRLIVLILDVDLVDLG